MLGKCRVWILILIGIVCVTSSSFSQKKRKNKKKRVATEKNLREAEYLFVDAQKYLMLEDFTKALVVLNKCLEITPDNAAVHFKFAEVYFKNENPKKALQYALKAIELDGNNKYYYILAANIYKKQGHHQEASTLYEEMISKIPNTQAYYLDLATIYLYQNRYDDALEAFTKAENTYRDSEMIAYQKQKIYLQLNNLQKAIDISLQLIKTSPDNPIHSTNLAKILHANGRIKKAIAILEKAKINHPNHGDILLMLADLYKKTGEMTDYERTITEIYESPFVDTQVKTRLLGESIFLISQARSSNMPNRSLESTTLKNAQQLTETHQDAYITAAYGDLLYAVGRKEEALDQYIKSTQLDNVNFQIWQNILQIESNLRRNADIIIHAEKALESFPNQAVIYMYLGIAQLHLGKYDQAASTLEIGKRLSIQNQSQIAIFSSLLGNAYNGNKKYEKSDKAYQEALSINPNDHQTLNNYSYFLSLRKENLESAEKMAKKVITISPNNPIYLDTYAWVLFMRQKYNEAKVQIEKAIAIGEPAATHHDHYGDILFKLGMIDQAVEQWKIAKDLDDSIDNIDKKIATRSIK